ncbi:DMT family transporter [Brevibacterium sp. BRM-1]|uniref:DMT family transporter n=1 Tax=Brevibacterium sp. BRM-1 TaxID=2999062 RepID=UPI0022818107|nr:DMT family transporter [Brevibacterium sp. BRM-1]WAL40795.1 DMT family transporter [Brevibacterium sp. BRM-1]
MSAAPVRDSPLAAVLAAAAAMIAGSAMAVQGHSNGVLAGIVGSGILAATVSFAGGLAVLIVVCAAWPSARRGIGRARRLVAAGQFPWFMLLGGVGGSLIVISQSLTVPLFGVSIFTMAFVCGQLGGALLVDNTDLPPGGRRHPTLPRLAGTGIVLAGVVVSSAGVFGQGIAWWAPLLPLIAGVGTAFQQAFNGRLKAAANSAAAATFTNFLVGTVFLAVCSALVLATGTPVRGAPELPAQWWTLIGGVLGVVFIGVSTLTVARLGVLLLSLTTLFGNLAGSLVTDVITGSAATALAPSTLIAMGLVLVGVCVASVPGRPLGRLR